MQTSFYLVFNHKGRKNKSGKNSVALCLYRSGCPRVYISTGVKIFANEWDARRQQIKASAPNSSELNRYLLDMIHRAKSYELTRLNASGACPLDEVAQAMRNRQKIGDFVAYIETDLLPRKRRTVSVGMAEQYRQLADKLRAFRNSVPFDAITPRFVSSFYTYLLGVVSRNTAARYMAILSASVNDATARGLVSGQPFIGFHAKREKREQPYLLPDEVARLERATVQNGREREALDVFLMGCYTGLRCSDILTLCPSELSMIDGVTWIKKSTKKTGQIVHIPISLLYGGKAMKILHRYTVAPDRPYFSQTHAAINTTIATIAERVGIVKRVSMHVGRRTFATLTQSVGVPNNVVQHILGHSSVTTTELYATTLTQQIETATRKAFA